MHGLFHGSNFLFLSTISVNHTFLQPVTPIFAPLE